MTAHIERSTSGDFVNLDVTGRARHPDRVVQRSRTGRPEEVHAASPAEHDASLPRALRAWLVVSNGFYSRGPVIHPISAIGPMVPFARLQGLVVQPESWFELGNPNIETICIDLAYEWPGGDCPVFASGDDLRGTKPRIIAPGFAEWLVRVLAEGGREFWLDPGFRPLGDPWVEHRRRAPLPPLPERLRPLAPRVLPLMHPGADDRSIAERLGVTRGDVEALFRHLQHVPGC